MKILTNPAKGGNPAIENIMSYTSIFLHCEKCGLHCVEKFDCKEDWLTSKGADEFRKHYSFLPCSPHIEGLTTANLSRCLKEGEYGEKFVTVRNQIGCHIMWSSPDEEK